MSVHGIDGRAALLYSDHRRDKNVPNKIYQGGEKEILVEPGTRILEAERKAKLVPDAPCGGRGKCGKCRVKIEDHMVLACRRKSTVTLK